MPAKSAKLHKLCIRVKYNEIHVLDQTYILQRMNGYFGGDDMCVSIQYWAKRERRSKEMPNWLFIMVSDPMFLLFCKDLWYIYNLFCWKAWIFPIYYFSFRAKSTMWFCNILDLCREKEFSNLTFPWNSMNSWGNYNYQGNITVRNQEPLLS